MHSLNSLLSFFLSLITDEGKAFRSFSYFIHYQFTVNIEREYV
jgi:hypothetical protein